MLYNGQQPRGLLEPPDNWERYGIYDIPVPYWYKSDFASASANGTLRGVWGISNVGLGGSSPSSPVLPSRYIAKYAFDDFFMGSFGLAAGQVGQDGSTKNTFLTQYEGSGKIASSSYGYGAGAYYRECKASLPFCPKISSWLSEQAMA